MYHLSDKELDRLSKEAAEQSDVEQNTSGWDVLEKRLNKELPVATEKKRRRFLFFLFFVVLLTGSGLIYTILPGKENPSVAKLKQDANNIDPEKPAQRISTTVSAEQNRSAPEVPLSSQDINNKGGEDQFDKTQSPPVPVAHSSNHETRAFKDKNNILGINKRKLLPLQKNSHLGPVPVGSPQKMAERKEMDNVPVTTEDDYKVASSQEPKANHGVSGSIPDSNHNDQKLSNDIPSTPEVSKKDSITATDSSGLSQAESLPIKKKQQDKQQKIVEVGLVIAPDFSNVRFTHNDKPGINIGMIIGYRFSNKWSLNTGFIYAKKAYTAKGKDYYPPKGYWTYNIDLDKVKAECYMFEIPVNIRYDLSKNRNRKYFISTGLSTYLMKQETYDYYYTYNGVYTSRERSYKTNKSYLFSIINISGGIERSINKRMSIQVEPYLKIPVRGVGYGSVRLNSYGIFFGLKYKPFLSHKSDPTKQ